MKRFLLVILGLLLFIPLQLDAQIQIQNKKINQNDWDKSKDRSNPEYESDYPWVPRVSAYEAHVKYKAGKAIIFHAGGNAFSARHILGAINLDIKPREKILAKFPKQGIEIFTYCY